MILRNDDGTLYDETKAVLNPEEIVVFLQKHTSKYIFDAYEHFLAVPVDSAMHIIGVEHVFEGFADQIPINMPKLFMSMLTKRKYRRMTAFFVVHNHPSGNVTPSFEDRMITKKIAQAANILDIKLLDHIVIASRPKSDSAAFTSIRRSFKEECFCD